LVGVAERREATASGSRAGSSTLASGLLHADVEPFSPTGSLPPKMTERHARKY
jgi:hypothetical protein